MTRPGFGYPVLSNSINTLNKWALSIRDLSNRFLIAERETIPELDSRITEVETDVSDHETRIAAIETDIGSGNWSSWTPSPSSSAGTGTYTVSNATSSSVGKTRYCSLYLKWSQTGGAHGSVSFTLPSVAKNNSVGQFCVGIYTEAATGTTFSEGYISIPSNGTGASIKRNLAGTTTWPDAAGTTNYAIANFFYEEN